MVPADHINAVWDSIKVLLQPAVTVTNGRYMLYDVYVSLQQSKMQLWIAFNDDKEIVGCQITSITDYPSRRVLTSLFTGGKILREWRDEMMSLLLRWAEDNECTGIEGYGRKGWIKMLEPYGVKRGLIMFEKDI
jgi:hypothetical protein